MSIPHETGRVRSGDVAIFYRKLGRPGGIPILIVHGLSYFSYDWLAAAEALGAAREAVAIDMRGFGDSDWSPAKDYSVPAMAQDIVTVLDHLGWKRALLAGHSMGGRSTTYVAAKHPARTAGLVLVDYSPENAPAGAKRVTQTVANTPDFFSSVEEAMRCFASEDRPRFEAYLRKSGDRYALKRDPHFRDQFRKALETGERPKLGVDMWSLIGEVRCPILSVRGTRSDMYAAETVHRMKAANSHLQVAEVDAGHNIAGENLNGFLSALSPFLDKLEESDEHQRR
jgi:pimeloyl-ACP methyl ester carboxylesterase